LYEFAVVGMGIAGLSTAIRLREYGYNVVLLGDEKSASASCAGIITLQLEDVKDILLVKESIKVINELMKKYGIDEAGVTCRGFISIEDSMEAEESAELLKKADVVFKQFDAKDASQNWPWLRISEDEIATYTMDDLSVEADHFIKFLIKVAREKGVDLEKDWVKEIVFGEKHKLLLQRTGEVEADVVTLCLGAWTRDFLLKNGIEIPVIILRVPAYRFKTDKEIIAFSDEVYESYWRVGVNRTIVGGGYHAEMVNDQSLFFQKSSRRFQVEAEKLLRFRLNGKIEFIEEWSGPISITPDLDPIMDNLPGYENVFFLDGLRGYGLMKGIALGYLLADIASGREDLERNKGYRLSRFSNLF